MVRIGPRRNYNRKKSFSNKEEGFQKKANYGKASNFYLTFDFEPKKNMKGDAPPPLFPNYNMGKANNYYTPIFPYVI